MPSNLEIKVAALIARAEADGVKSKPSPRRRSSLHDVIKTKEQAERFMKLLRSA